MRRLFLLALLLPIAGCAAAALPLASPAFQGAATVAGTAGSTATGWFSTQSAVELNDANIKLIDAQAGLMKQQAIDARDKRKLLDTERAATVGILRDAAIARNDPTIANLAIWVAAGGDPGVAMNYLLKHPAKDGAGSEPVAADAVAKK